MATDGDALWLHAYREISIVELAQTSGLSEVELRELVEYGALHPMNPQDTSWRFSAECVGCLRTAARLRNDLELETRGLALALSFLERIEELQAEIRKLRAQSPR